MADCKAKYRNAVNQFIRLVSVDAKAYITFIKQVKEISLQYQTDLRDANIAEVRASVKHLDGRYFDQELAIEFDKPPQATQPGDAESWDEATRAAADDVWDATAKATNSLEDLYNKIKVLSGKLSTKAFNKFMEQVKLPQVSITVVQDPADEAFSPDDLKVKSHMPRPAHLSQKPKPTVLLGALVHWLMRNNLLKKKDGYSIEQCSNDFGCSKTILKRVISGKKQKGGREYKREAEARERSDAPPTEEERPEQPTAPVAEDAPAADPEERVFINLQELVCKWCEEEYAPEEVLINHYNIQHPECVQYIVCRYCYEILQGYPSYLEHVDEHNADNCKCLLCNKVCRTLNKLGKHMKKSHPVSEKADDPGDQAEDAPKDTGEVEDTAQQEQATGDPDELPDLVLDEPRIQPPQPPPAAAGAPTPGTPEKEKEKKGHKEASEKYKIVCEACNRYFQDVFTRSGHINTYHKEIIRQCGFCKSGFLYPWDYDKHLDATHVWCDDCHKFVKDRATFNKHYRKFHDRQQEVEDPQQQQPTPQPQSTGASAGAGTGISMGTGTATQATSAENRQFGCSHCSSSFSTRTELLSHVNQKHRTIKCQDCDKMFVLAADRDNHRRDVHAHPKHSCDAPQCKVFKINSDELHQHKRDAHWDVFRFRCCVRPCYNVFKDRDTLMDHLFKVHDRGFARTKGQIPSYECDKCERTFQSIGMLIHHSSEHQENKRQCTECAWRFATWHRLIDHCINTHDTMRHACATCGKDFKTNDEKVTHCSQKHTGKCWICDKDFVLVEQLQVHLRDEHKMKDATSAEKTKELEEEHRRELERKRRWERQQRAAAKRKMEDDDDDDNDQGDRSGKRKKDDDPDYRPSKKQLKKADKRGDK